MRYSFFKELGYQRMSLKCPYQMGKRLIFFKPLSLNEEVCFIEKNLDIYLVPSFVMDFQAFIISKSVDCYLKE